MSGVIYKIVTGNEVYVGSTFNTYTRFAGHKSRLKTGFKCPLYDAIRANNNEYEITIYDENLSMTEKELCKYEQEVIKILGSTLNGVRAYTTDEDKRQQNIKDCRNYYYKNRETQLEKKRAKITCECGSVVASDKIARHRRTAKHARLMTSLSQA